MAARKWSVEQRLRQAELIKVWKPWAQSTGPRTGAGKQAASRNAYKGGKRPSMRLLSEAVTEMLRHHEEILRRVKS